MFEMLCTRYSHTSIGDMFGVGLTAQIYKNLKNFIKDLTNASRERERDVDVTTSVKCGVASCSSWSISLWNP
jgi:hypothetical protein